MKLKFTVEGLDCPVCASKLATRMAEIEGVEHVKINFLSEKLTVDTELSEAELLPLNKVADGEGDQAGQHIAHQNGQQAAVIALLQGLAGAQVAGDHHEQAVAAVEQPAGSVGAPHQGADLIFEVKTVVQKTVDAVDAQKSETAQQVNAGFSLLHKTSPFKR